MGHAKVDASESGRKRYAITDEGRAFLDAEREHVEAATARMQRTARSMTRGSSAMAVRCAMYRLRHAMMARRGAWSDEEAARLCDILERATADIERG